MATLRRSIVVSILFTLFGGPGMLLVVVPFFITRFRIPGGQPVLYSVAASCLMIAGLMPLVESIWRFIVVGRGTLVPTMPTEHLVVSGLYQYVRNPMYLGVFTVMAGEALLFASRGVLVELAISALGMELFVGFYEEPRLIRTFPQEYALYRSQVRRWLPRLTPWNRSKG